MGSSDESSSDSSYNSDYFDPDDNFCGFKVKYLEKVRKFLLQCEFPSEINCDVCYFSYYTKLTDLLVDKKKLYDQAFFTDALLAYIMLEDLFRKLENKDYDVKSEYFLKFEEEMKKIIEKHDKYVSHYFTFANGFLYDGMIKIWPICGKAVPSNNNCHNTWKFSTEILH